MTELFIVAAGSAVLVAAGLAAWRRVRGRCSRGAAVLRAALLAAVVVPLTLAGAHALSNARSVQLVGTIIHRVDTAAPLVALTFDDGPAPYGADSILQVLAAFDATATFFVTGAELERYPELARRFVTAGH